MDKLQPYLDSAKEWAGKSSTVPNWALAAGGFVLLMLLVF